MKRNRGCRFAGVTLFGALALLGAGAASAQVGPLIDCGPGRDFRPITFPVAFVETQTAGLCVLCSVQSPLNVIDLNPLSFATLRTTVGVAANVSLSVSDVSTIYGPGRRAGFILRNPAQPLSLDLLHRTRITTSKNGIPRQTFAVDGGLRLDLLGLLGQPNLFFLSGVPTQEFDTLTITFGSVARVLTSLQVFSACVANS